MTNLSSYNDKREQALLPAQCTLPDIAPRGCSRCMMCLHDVSANPLEARCLPTHATAAIDKRCGPCATSVAKVRGLTTDKRRRTRFWQTTTSENATGQR